ncbi:YdeI/OmpD-associated family protein [uncultured Phycicoccus sp.]|uniref:YdeI/OmpD-associated family protein n=1 Tax=uncultured Phycicoccus sp. TaxID=661422 RepID=UPI00260CB789|nr:YdeI/OmpD-associated family protein [uncultured Phycicoccus sp.]
MSTDTRAAGPAPVRFEAVLAAIDDTCLVRLPAEASRRLPSRGQVAVHATLQGHPFETVVEPDGLRGHWVRVGEALQRAAGLEPGDTAEVTLTVTTEWPEPEVPDDLRAALDAAPASIRDLWADITPMARWEWVRWVRATANPDTRQRRVEVSISKLDDGKRRPCCFDLSSCTDPAVARSGRLREPQVGGSGSTR